MLFSNKRSTYAKLYERHDFHESLSAPSLERDLFLLSTLLSSTISNSSREDVRVSEEFLSSRRERKNSTFRYIHKKWAVEENEQKLRVN
jgi:hypothetical protein